MAWLSITLGALALGAGWMIGRGRGKAAPVARVVPSELTRDSLIVAFQGIADSEDARRDDDKLIVDVLRMVADQHGASVAGLWLPSDNGSASLVPVLWSREQAPTLGARELGLVHWASENDVLAFDRADGAPRFVAAKAGEGDAAGALVLVFEEDAKATRDALKYWLPRHATRVTALRDVLESRAESAKVNLRLRAAMRTAMALQGTRDPLELEETFAKQSLAVAGSEWSVLVRWDPKGAHGEVRAVTHDGVIAEGKSAVYAGSLLGDVCIDGAPVVYDDTRAIIDEGRELIDGSPVPRDTGSLILVPIKRSKEERAIGALACGHPLIGMLGTLEARTTRDLAIVAAGALSTAWVVEDARASARRDGLTELFNRRAFEELFAKAVEWTDRQEGSAMALVMVDVDFFKKVNDTYGHDAGDRVLQAMARVLTRDRRGVDTVARLGGEELALILPGVTEKSAVEVAERLRERIEATRVNTNAGEVRVTASFGVAIYRSRAGDSSKMFERADKALYAAKHGGRNRVVLADRA